MRGECRNELKASEHYRRHLLVWTVAAWRLYVTVIQREREAEQARQTTQNKMAAFLNAAASGQLWTDRTSDDAEVACDGDGIVMKGPVVRCIALNIDYQLRKRSRLLSLLNMCYLSHSIFC